MNATPAHPRKRQRRVRSPDSEFYIEHVEGLKQNFLDFDSANGLCSNIFIVMGL